MLLLGSFGRLRGGARVGCRPAVDGADDDAARRTRLSAQQGHLVAHAAPGAGAEKLYCSPVCSRAAGGPRSSTASSAPPSSTTGIRRRICWYSSTASPTCRSNAWPISRYGTFGPTQPDHSQPAIAVAVSGRLPSARSPLRIGGHITRNVPNLSHTEVFSARIRYDFGLNCLDPNYGRQRALGVTRKVPTVLRFIRTTSAPIRPGQARITSRAIFCQFIIRSE